MKTHMLLRKLYSWRIALFALIIVFTSVVIPFSGLTSSTAHAATLRECYDKYNNKDVSNTQLPNDCQNLGCKYNQPIQGKISCPSPDTLPDTAVKAAADAAVKPLQTLVCGPIPPNEALLSVYTKCAAKVRAAYTACDNSAVPIPITGGFVQNTDADTAKCVRDKLNPKPVLADIVKAVHTGRVTAKGITDEATAAIQAQKKKDQCEAAGGTWENSACSTDNEDKPTCNVDQIGWIVCPVTNFLSFLADNAYSGIAHFLTVQPLVTNNTNDGMYKAWSIMRNFSNVAFVIAFLIIIFSQVTSIGVSNYGIKKMLPKIIIAAVLVNVSYWLCAILVDISNIAGSSISDLFKGISGNLALPDKPNTSTGQGTAGLVGAAAAIFVSTGVVLYVGLSALIPLVIAAAITALTVFIILVLRQVLIILLIVVSPLAFVAFLLPNTESLFKKWRSLLTTLLVLFPLTGLVFGASGLAGTVIMNGANAGDEFTKIIYQTTGAAVPILGLVLLVFLIKGLTSALGTIGGKMLGFINNPNKGPFDRLRKSGEAFRGYNQNVTQTRRRRRARGQGVIGGVAGSIGSEGSGVRKAAMWLAGSGVTAGMNRDRKYSNAEAVNKSDEQSYVANRAATDTEYAQHITAPTGNADVTKAYAIEAADQEWKKDVAAAKSIFEHEGATFQDLSTQIKGGNFDNNPSKKNAALQRFFELANSEGTQDMIEHLGELRSQPGLGGQELENVERLQKTAADSLASSSMKPVDLSGSNLSKMKTGNFTATEAERIKDTVSDGKTTAQHIAKMDVDEMRRWNAQLNDPNLLGDVEYGRIDATYKAIVQAQSDPRLNVSFGDREKVELEALKQKLEVAKQNAAYQSYEDAGNIR